jgi:hypothetical protein
MVKAQQGQDTNSSKKKMSQKMYSIPNDAYALVWAKLVAHHHALDNLTR